MNAFEQIVAGLFNQDGYWTRLNYKVDLPKLYKANLGKPSLPRPEIDILAYRAVENRLVWVECKSYLDSRGVKIDFFIDKSNTNQTHYKVFTWPDYRKWVSKALVDQVEKQGLVLPNPKVDYCLVTGHIASEIDRVALHKYFEEHCWLLIDENQIKEKLQNLSEIGHEDDVADIVAKIFSKTARSSKSNLKNHQ